MSDSAAPAPGQSAAPRQRLLDAAADLFYRQGTVSVGVDLLSKTAGVSKRTLYQQFGSKDQLIADTLDANGTAIVGRYLPPPDSDDPPRRQILAVFERLGQWAAEPAFRGCPFINTSTELPDPGHPAREVARRYTRQIRGFFARQAALGGADDAELLADQLLIAFDGAIVQAVIGTASRRDAARAIAQALLDAHHLG
jgi:AcrR family transcriptional regulator